MAVHSEVSWLAAHIRRTDKLLQSPGNRHANDRLLDDIIELAARAGHGGVLLCTDDADLKQWLVGQLRAQGLAVAAYEAQLSDSGLPCHKDHNLDRYRTAEDVLVETLAMAWHCEALISTWSNVSTAVVFFAKEDFEHHMFGDGFA